MVLDHTTVYRGPDVTFQKQQRHTYASFRYINGLVSRDGHWDATISTRLVLRTGDIVFVLSVVVTRPP